MKKLNRRVMWSRMFPNRKPRGMERVFMAMRFYWRESAWGAAVR